MSGGSLSQCPIGVVPIVWNNVDLPELSEPVDAELVMDEVARLGFEGVQHGTGFSEGPSLKEDLGSRGLRLAEVYAAISCSADGPSPGSFDDVVRRLEILNEGDGDMLVVALDIDPLRSEFAGRSDRSDCPPMSEGGWDRLATLLAQVASAVERTGRNCSFHPHVGTFIENPTETERLAQIIQPTCMGLCLDVGHFLLGGGDPIEAIRRYEGLITHVHLKDVDPLVMESLGSGELDGFQGGLRHRVFTELGSGTLPLQDVLEALSGIDYRGWMMIEQDTSWLRPSEASAISQSVARYALRLVG